MGFPLLGVKFGHPTPVAALVKLAATERDKESHFHHCTFSLKPSSPTFETENAQGIPKTLE